MAITPNGTFFLPIIRPFGRCFMEVISPIGSSNCTIWYKPSAMPSILASVSVRRSIIAGFIWFFFAASMSFALAAWMVSRFASSASAAAFKALLRSVIPVFASWAAAVFARCPITVSVSIFFLPSIKFLHFYDSLFCRHFRLLLQNRLFSNNTIRF